MSHESFPQTYRLPDRAGGCPHGKSPDRCRDCANARRELEASELEGSRAKQLDDVSSLAEGLLVEGDEDEPTTCPHGRYPANACGECVGRAMAEAKRLVEDFRSRVDALDDKLQAFETGKSATDYQGDYRRGLEEAAEGVKRELSGLRAGFFHPPQPRSGGRLS